MNQTKISLLTKGLATLAVAFMLQSCQKDEILPVAEEDAADVVMASLESESGGMAEETAMKTEYITEKNNQLECGETRTLTRTFTKSTGIRTANFTYNWEMVRNCNDGVTTIDWTGIFNGTFETPRLSGTTTGSRNWTISGFETDSNTLFLTGSFNRSGSHTSKVRKQRSFSTEVNCQFEEVVVNRSTRQIESGSGDVQISINASDGTSRNFTGEITFNGNGSATLVVNGKTFEITIN